MQGEWEEATVADCEMLRQHILRLGQSCLYFPEIAKKARRGDCEIFRAMKLKDSRKLNLAMSAHREKTKEDILDYVRRTRERSDSAC